MEISRIGPFVLEERLGGAQSSVYRVLHTEHRRPFALKLYDAPFASGDEARARFAQEWGLLKRLRNPHIVRCFGGGLEGSVGYLCYELVPGETLADVFARRGKLPWEEVVQLGVQVADALNYAHQKGLIHQDLCPDKIHVLPDGTVKVGDFRRDRGSKAEFQSAGPLTRRRVRYQAPEQLAGELLTRQSDLYSLGCVLYHAVTGEPPFNGKSVEEIRAGHLQQPPQEVAKQVLECPIWLSEVIAQLLHKKPLKRPNGAPAVALALQETQAKVAAGVSAVEHAAGGISALKKGLDKQTAQQLIGGRRRSAGEERAAELPGWLVPAGLAAALLAVVAVAVWLALPPGEEALFSRAEALLASGDQEDAYYARRDYLEPLVRRFPSGQYAERAQAMLREMDIDIAQRRLQRKLKMGLRLDSEHERLLAQAWRYEQFGDRATALEKYLAIAALISEEASDDEPYVALARKRANELEDGKLQADRVALLNKRLEDAEQLQQQGKAVEAQRIWRSIESLYAGNRELQTQVAQARARLRDEPSTAEQDSP